MKIEEAIKTLLETPHPIFTDRMMSKYYIAKQIGVRPIMIDNWLNGEYNGISDRVVNGFKGYFDIDLTHYQSVMSIKDGTLNYSLM